MGSTTAMTSDRELLELAAKGAGYTLLVATALPPGIATAEVGYWNPLHDDGDAFRLAVKLNMQVPPHTDWFSRPIGDPCEYTRRAIVRFAAEIARRST